MAFHNGARFGLFNHSPTRSLLIERLVGSIAAGFVAICILQARLSAEKLKATFTLNAKGRC